MVNSSMLNQVVMKIFSHFGKALFGLCSVYVILICSASVRANAVPGASVEDLYTDADHILNLNKSNFYSRLLGKQNVIVLEFYNSWCGYCIGYAPVWKKFANDVKGWRKVSQVAALNCAHDENVEICRQYQVTKYPMIRNFWTNVQLHDLGRDEQGSFSIQELRQQLLDFITKRWKDGVPSHWPSLQPIKSTSLRDIWKNLPSSANSVVLIVENAESYIGREVILDLSAYNNLTIQRTLDTNSKLLDELKKKIDLESLPSMLLLEKDYSVRLLSSSSSKPREDFRDILEKKLLGKKDLIEVTVPPLSTAKMPKKVLPVTTSVFMVDLENTLHYIIKQEIVLQQLIQGQRFEALQSFMEILDSAFPGREPVKRFLHGLYVYLSKRKTGKVTATEILGAIDNLQTDESFLPPMEEWMECKGSTAKYRGFPCGLWTLFHVLTVEAYQQYKKGKDDFSLPERTLLPIRDYVLNFFSCSECAKNFRSESADIEDETKFPNDTVLWLWRTHNRVNKRLEGQASEDPLHPKLQFPPAEACGVCHLTESTPENPLWNESATLQFLVNHYGNIERTDDGSNRLSRTAQGLDSFVAVHSGAASADFLVWHKMSWVQFKYFSGTDISLCVLLYVLSGLLLVLVYFVFMLRKKRRKMPGLKLP